MNSRGGVSPPVWSRRIFGKNKPNNEKSKSKRNKSFYSCSYFCGYVNFVDTICLPYAHARCVFSVKDNTLIPYALFYLNFLSYKRAASIITKTEPKLCTKAPVVGPSRPNTESTTATILISIERVILKIIVLTVARDSFLR